jgi:formylglycine-generating enzyme required for sulfatase activity
MTMSVAIPRLSSVALALAFSLFALSASAQAPGTTFKDCANCPEMVVVPAGSFTMGSPESEAGRFPNENQVQVRIPRPFAVGKFEVTFDEYDACLAEGGCQVCIVPRRGSGINAETTCNNYRPRDQGFGRGRRPVIYIGFTQMEAYLQWLSMKTGKTYRLLSEAEWEYAARAGTTTAFGTGRNTISSTEANVLHIEPGQTAHAALLEVSAESMTKPVGSYPPNAFGIHDMHGNVAELTADCGNNNSHTGNPGDGTARKTGNCNQRMIRGGSWVTRPDTTTRSAFRDAVPNEGFNDQGFRVARDL